MANLLVSGLLNTETTVRVRKFPVEYYPIDYPFFGVNTGVSGVALNVAKALTCLGDNVRLASMIGPDLSGRLVLEELRQIGLSEAYVTETLKQTPSSVVLYDENGRRQIYCDLKDIQETTYDFPTEFLDGIDAVAACNINFNRSLLAMAKAKKLPVATDVHVLSDPDDAYNRDFMAAAEVLFLSDEGVHGDKGAFLWTLADRYQNRVLVMGLGAEGALLCLPGEGRLLRRPACQIGGIVNTVGAGDALFSAFIHGYYGGLSPVEALDRAQLFAALKIRHNGAAEGFVSAAELEAAFCGI